MCWKQLIILFQGIHYLKGENRVLPALGLNMLSHGLFYVPAREPLRADGSTAVTANSGPTSFMTLILSGTS